MSEDNTSWADPWDYPINPVYDTLTGKLIGAADVPRSVPYWVTDGESHEGSIQKRDNDSCSFMTYSNSPPGSQSDLDTVSLDPLGLPKSHHWESERAKPAAILARNPPSHNVCGYIPPELRDENIAANRKNRLSRNQLNRFYEIIEGHPKRFSNPQIGRDAAIQHENWHKAEAVVEPRIDNRKPLSTRTEHLIDPMDRRAPTTSWQQSSTASMIAVSQDSRYYARISSPVNSKEAYYASDVPTRFVTPTQEHFSDSRFVKPAHDHLSDSRLFTPSQKDLSDSRFAKPCQEHFRSSRFFAPSHKHLSDSRFVTPSQEHFWGSRFVTPPQKYISDSRFVTSSQKHVSDSRFPPANFANRHAQRSNAQRGYAQRGYAQCGHAQRGHALHEHAQRGHAQRGPSAKVEVLTAGAR